ncbi:hypothetical protein MKX01_019754 [Papaver californicum]|nr:hypothetical protein MKX01_019754 [Papaver californicum]
MAMIMSLHQSLLLRSPQTKTLFPSWQGLNLATPKLYSQSKPSTIRFRSQSKKKSNNCSIVAAQSNIFYKVIQTVWSVGKDGIEAGTNLVPSSVPRPVAKISVTIGAAALSLFVLKSLVSTVTFVLVCSYDFIFFCNLNYAKETPKSFYSIFVFIFPFFLSPSFGPGASATTTSIAANVFITQEN